jgi:hypothetical protein
VCVPVCARLLRLLSAATATAVRELLLACVCDVGEGLYA